MPVIATAPSAVRRPSFLESLKRAFSKIFTRR
jgi:hypothetical protein